MTPLTREVIESMIEAEKKYPGSVLPIYLNLLSTALALYAVKEAADIVIKDEYWRCEGRHELRESLKPFSKEEKA